MPIKTYSEALEPDLPFFELFFRQKDLFEISILYITGNHFLIIELTFEAIKWGAEYFIKCHTSEYVFYGQVNEPDKLDEFWGRPQDLPEVYDVRSFKESFEKFGLYFNFSGLLIEN